MMKTNNYYLKSTSPSNDGDSVICVIIDNNTYEEIRLKIKRDLFLRTEYKEKNECEISNDDFRKLSVLDLYTKAIYKGINLLSYSQMTKKGLEIKLHRYNFPKEVSSFASKYLEKKGFINEKLQGELLIDTLANKKLYGKNRIKKDLYVKGFSEDIIQSLLNEAEIDFDEICAIRIRKTIDINDFEDIGKRQKIFAKLKTSGFTNENIKNALVILHEE